MRIAIYHNLLSGGAKRAIGEYVRRGSGQHTLDVYTLSSSNHDFADLRPYVNAHRIYPFQAGKLFRSPFGRINQAVRLADLMRIETLTRKIAGDIEQEGYDLVFAQPCQLENSPSVLRFLHKTPSIFFCQEPLRILYEEMPTRPYDARDSLARRSLNRLDPLPGLYRRELKKRDARNLRSAGRVLVNSNFVRQSVERIYQVQARVCYLGVDHELFQPQGLEREAFVLSVGSLTPLKGFDFLVRALAHVPAERRPVLVITSNFQNPPEKDYLEGLASGLGVKLELRRDTSDAALVSLYSRAALTLYAPIREPFGLVAIESMACATPLVAVREGGVQETVVDGQVGLLTERSEAEFARAVDQMLCDPDRRAAYGKNGRQQILKQWTWDCAIERVEEQLAGLA
jgi:glycosyltransferase involved in cell wall biosynthesis